MNKTKRSVGLAQDRREGFGCIKASRLVHVHRFIRHGAPTYPTCNSRTLPRCLHLYTCAYANRIASRVPRLCFACVYFAPSPFSGSLCTDDSVGKRVGRRRLCDDIDGAREAWSESMRKKPSWLFWLWKRRAAVKPVRNISQTIPVLYVSETRNTSDCFKTMIKTSESKVSRKVQIMYYMYQID